MRIRSPFLPACVISLVALIGCGGSPSAVNIQLRKDLQNRDDLIENLKREHEADLADLHASTRPTTESLSPAELAKLFTTHGLKLGNLTGGSDFDSGKPGDRGLKIYACPTDDDGQALKAAGEFTVQAFDLSLPSDNLIGSWTFDAATTRQDWYGSAFLYTYVLPCPWQQRTPTHSNLMVRVTFHDELTSREFTQEKAITVNLPAATQP
jgi:hypothetical protein